MRGGKLGDVPYSPLPRIEGKELPGPVVVAHAERVEIQVDRTRLKATLRFGSACGTQKFCLRGPSVVVEGPGAIRDVDMTGVRRIAWPEPNRLEACIWVGLQERVRQDVASSGGEECHVIPVPREQLILSLGVGTSEACARTVHDRKPTGVDENDDGSIRVHVEPFNAQKRVQRRDELPTFRCSEVVVTGRLWAP